MSAQTRWRVIAVMVLMMWADVGYSVWAESYPPMPWGWHQWAVTALGIALLLVGTIIVAMEVFRKPKPIVYGTEIE